MSSDPRAVVNHGVSSSLVDETFRQTRALFGLPLEEKERILQDENSRGYTPFNVRRGIGGVMTARAGFQSFRQRS